MILKGNLSELFLNVGKAGSDTYATAEALGRLISLALRLESPVSRAERAHELADQLQNIGARMDVVEQPSIPDALAQVLQEALTESAPAVPDSAITPEPVHPEVMTKAVQVFSECIKST